MTFASFGSNSGIQIGQWAAIQIFYRWNYKDSGSAQVFRNNVQMFNAFAVIAAGFSSSFADTNFMRIGGGFIGQIRRIQIYSPVGSSPNQYCTQKKRKSSHILLVGLDSAQCASSFGYANPPICSQAICGAGFYSSFGSCESKDLVSTYKILFF